MQAVGAGGCKRCELSWPRGISEKDHPVVDSGGYDRRRENYVIWIRDADVYGVCDSSAVVPVRAGQRCSGHGFG